MPEVTRQPTSAGVGAAKTVGYGSAVALLVAQFLPGLSPEIQSVLPVLVLGVLGFAGKFARNMAAAYVADGNPVPWWVRGLGFG